MNSRFLVTVVLCLFMFECWVSSFKSSTWAFVDDPSLSDLYGPALCFKRHEATWQHRNQTEKLGVTNTQPTRTSHVIRDVTEEFQRNVPDVSIIGWNVPRFFKCSRFNFCRQNIFGYLSSDTWKVNWSFIFTRTKRSKCLLDQCWINDVLRSGSWWTSCFKGSNLFPCVDKRPTLIRVFI